MIIKPSTTLRNEYLTISNLAHEKQEPIYITKNGEGDLVVMSVEAFERREEIIRLKAVLDAAEKSRLNGEPTISIDEVRRKLAERYANA